MNCQINDLFKYISKERMKKENILYVTVMILIISGCATAYVPNIINTPLLSNKGEVQAGVHTGLSGTDLQFSYAVTDNIGVMLNGSFANRTSDNTDDFHKHKFVELGTGYYTKIGENGRFETFGGYGYGKLKADFNNSLWNTHLDVNTSRFFVQPAIGVTTDIFDGSLASRFVMVKMHQASNKTTEFFFEPVITSKVGYKNVKAVFQLGFSIPLISDNIDFNYQPFLFSIGLQGLFFKR